MRPHYRIALQIDPSDAEVRRLEQHLREYNISSVGDTRRLSFLVTLLDAESNTVGGLLGTVSYQWLFVDTLWLAENSRRQGHGRELLRRAEEEARRHGCTNAWLDTFSFQARAFYEKNGYTVFGELSDFPPGHARYFLRKSLL